jgi:hypothetical protein
MTSMPIPLNGVDTNWYFYTSAIDHITGELNKLCTHDKHKGCHRVANKSYWSFNVVHPSWFFHLNNVQNVPSASKNLMSVYKLPVMCFLSFTHFCFLKKDRAKRRIMLKGPRYGSLYLLVPLSTVSFKQAFITMKPIFFHVGSPSRTSFLLCGATYS